MSFLCGFGMDPFSKPLGKVFNSFGFKHGGSVYCPDCCKQECECCKRGGKRKKVKVSQKAAQNVTVNVKNVMRNDRTMIMPDMYKRQMDQAQNIGRQNLFSGVPFNFAVPPPVIHIQHPNIFREPKSDLVGVGTNPNPNVRRVQVEDNNLNQPFITPVNPNDITQRIPDRRMVPSENMLPAFNIAGNMGVTPELPLHPLQAGPIPHQHSPSLDMVPVMPSMRAEPSQPSMAGMGSQIIGGVEQYAVDIPHETTPAEKRRGRPLKEAGAPKGTYNRKARSPERSPSVAAQPSARDVREPTPYGQWLEK
jgi:hypothetical protein